MTTLSTTFALPDFQREISILNPDAPVDSIETVEMAEHILMGMTKCSGTDHFTAIYCNLSNGRVKNLQLGSLIENYFPKDRKTSTEKLGGHYLCRQRNPEKYGVNENYRARVVLAGGRSAKMVMTSTIDTSDKKVATILAGFGM